MLTTVGVLPLSSINIGLQSSIAALGFELQKLNIDLGELQLALGASVEVAADFPPDLSAYATAMASFTPPDIILALDPSNWLTLAADANIDVGLKLGLVTLLIEGLGPIVAKIEAGLSIGDLWGWSYSGGAHQFGIDLQVATRNGFGKLGPRDIIDATILATESFASWQQLSRSMNAPLGERLRFLGHSRADNWSVTLADLNMRIGRFGLELEGLKASLEASLLFSLGVDLPDPLLVIDAGVSIVADVGIEAIIENLVSVRADIIGPIADLSADIDATVALIADLNAQLSAGGIAAWKYSGEVGAMGDEFAAAINDGLPSGSGPNAHVYGFIIGGSRSAMSAFGSIFL